MVLYGYMNKGVNQFNELVDLVTGTKKICRRCGQNMVGVKEFSGENQEEYFYYKCKCGYLEY